MLEMLDKRIVDWPHRQGSGLRREANVSRTAHFRWDVKPWTMRLAD